MKTLADRLAAVMLANKQSKDDLASAIGIPIAKVESWLVRSLELSVDDYSTLGLFYSCSGEWFRTGRGLTPAILEKPPAPKQIKAAANPPKHAEPVISTADFQIPYLDLSASNWESFNRDQPAYTGKVITLPEYYCRSLLASQDGKLHLAAMFCLDYSMVPTFGEGDTLIVDLSQTDTNHYGVYVYCLPSGLFIKRLCLMKGDVLTYTSDNDSHRAIEISAELRAQMKVIGRIIKAIKVTDV